MGVHIRRGGFYPALFLFSVFFLSIFQIKSYDLWWHLKAGEFIVGTGFVGAGLKPAPTSTFSWTEPGHPWVNFSWIFDVIVYSIHNAAGFNGLIIFQAILVTAVFFAVYKTIVTPDSQLPTPNLLFLLFLIPYFASRFRFSLRPHLLALLFFSIDIYLLNRLSAISSQRSAIPFSLWKRVRSALSRVEGVRVPLFAIPLLQILWANVHGSAIIGALLPGIYLLGVRGEGSGSSPKTYALITLLSLLSSLLNPYGYHILADSFVPFLGQGSDLFKMLTIDEWQMPGKEMFFGWYGLLLAIGVVSFLLPFLPFRERPYTSSLSLRERVRVRVGSTNLLLFSTFAILSIKAVRFIDLFAVAAVPVIYKNVVGGQWSVVSEEGEKSEVRSQKLNSHPSSLILHPFLILSLFWFIGIRGTTFTLGFGVDEEVIPKKAVEFMERNGIRDKMFNSYNFGGYLLYRGYPVFIDGRLCYSPELVKDFADANLANLGWKMIEERYMPDVVLIEYDKPAIPEALLIDKENWALVYWDDLDMLFLKRNEKFSAIIAKNEYRDLNPMDMNGQLPSPQPSPIGRGGEGKGEEIKEIPSPLWGEGRGEGVFAEAKRRIENGPESMRAHLLLGNLYMTRGEADKAAVEYETVIKSSLSFGKAEAHNNLGTVYKRIGDLDSAEMEYKRALRLDKTYPLPQRNLGYLKLEQSEYIEALWHLDRHLQLSKGDRNTRAIMYDLKRYRDTLILRVFIGGSAIIGIIWIVARQFTPSPSGRGLG